MSNKTLYRITACNLLNQIEKDFHLVMGNQSHKNWATLPQKHKKFFIEWSWNESSWLRPYVEKTEDGDCSEWVDSLSSLGDELLAWAKQDNRMIVASNNRIVARWYLQNRSIKWIMDNFDLSRKEVCFMIGKDW